jgi:hypothetical protein
VFLEVVNVHVPRCPKRRLRAEILRGRYSRSSEAGHEDAVHTPPKSVHSSIPGKEKCVLSASAQLLHEACTAFPQSGRNR